ncbi:hypothetical protein GJAV_G00227850 [Gymnothorax javanicus]|nr:hypothetical protein GJAV_G00227850 [Gymnothorax javanicus]
MNKTQAAKRRRTRCKPINTPDGMGGDTEGICTRVAMTSTAFEAALRRSSAPTCRPLGGQRCINVTETSGPRLALKRENPRRYLFIAPTGQEAGGRGGGGCLTGRERQTWLEHQSIHHSAFSLQPLSHTLVPAHAAAGIPENLFCTCQMRVHIMFYTKT